MCQSIDGNVELGWLSALVCSAYLTKVTFQSKLNTVNTGTAVLNTTVTASVCRHHCNAQPESNKIFLVSRGVTFHIIFWSYSTFGRPQKQNSSLDGCRVSLNAYNFQNLWKFINETWEGVILLAEKQTNETEI